MQRKIVELGKEEIKKETYERKRRVKVELNGGNEERQKERQQKLKPKAVREKQSKREQPKEKQAIVAIEMQAESRNVYIRKYKSQFT